MFGLGVLFVVVNLITIYAMGRYYPYLAVLVPVFLITGGFMLITGKPSDPNTGLPPMWWKVVLGILAVASLGAGAWLAFWLGAD